MKTYLIVTNDEFEHPVKEIVGSKEVAEFLGVQRQTFSKYMTNGFPKCHEYKAVVIKEVQYETAEEKKARQKYNFQKWYANQDLSKRNEYARNYARLRRKRDIKRRNTMENAIKQIADKYGYDAQSRQLIEECAELIQAVNKLWRLEQVKNRTVTQDIDLSFAKEHLVEELADVQIMIEQMVYMLNCEYDFNNKKLRKIKRQLERMKAKQVEAV